ncbi:MAG TPA: TonB-dependent siderophore receptor [Pseudohongiella sp.]|nr:TonB-dependent siderophore receptor [Gammaproteobacteria bacterium]HBN14735.1 TonB-dependent siderophore receptor [Pseudohongiella sp.]
MKTISAARTAALIPLLSGFSLLPLHSAIAAQEEPAFQEEIIITSIRADRNSRGATGLDLDVAETPQSLTILDTETLESFGLEDINSMLKLTTGVNVDSSETDRTYYNARGFDITSMHVDGVGMPFGELVVGDIDTAIYEKVEIIRGSNGLITGLGNPSGTINYVRKRPGNEFAMSTRLTVGRWDTRRAEFDISTPLVESGRWAARFVGVAQDGESWLNNYANDRAVGSLVIDGQIGNSVTVALGYTRQDNNSDAPLWGASPMIYSNGQQLDFDVSTSTAMEWSYWDTLSERSFVELGWQLADDWRVESSVTHIDYADNSEVFYVYSNTGLDADSGLGMLSYPGKFDASEESLIWDTSLQGSFQAFDREHELNLGVSLADQDSGSLDHTALSGFQAMPAFPGWQGNEVARPSWDTPYQAAEEDTQLNRLYGSLLLSMTDRFKVILGMNVVDYENRGVSWGVSTDSDEDGSSPYVGFTWELLDSLNLYASYSDIYQPQYYLDMDLQPLGSAEGKSYEAGLKKQFDSSWLATVAVFKTEQENLQEFVRYGDGDGIDDTDYSDDFDFAMYRGISVDSTGIELEVAGEVAEGLRLQAGYTYLQLEDPNGDETRTFIPRNTFKMLADWRPVWQQRLALGLSARWQDDIYFDSAYGRISQDAYAVIGGYARYDVSESLAVSLNVDNALDEKYLSSVKFEQSYYAAPQNYSLSVDWQF